MTNLSETEQHARATFAAGDFVKAEMLFQKLALAAPRDAVAQYNLGVCVSKLDRFEDALVCYRRAIELNPGFADAYTNFGVCLNALNLIPQARQAFAIAHKLTPENPIPTLNEGIAALALGDYEAGWQGFDARWQLPTYAKFKRVFEKPLWDGHNIAGKTLFLYAEQGFGDTIQMVRYVPVLETQGIKIILEVPPALTSLIQSLEGSAEIITKGEPIPDFDFYCALMDLPGLLHTTLETIPNNIPYLFGPQEQKQQGSERPRIGLCWAGRSSHENDKNRSMAFAELLPLLKNTNVEWISLQRHVAEGDKADLVKSNVLRWGESFADFSAAAAAIVSCDLIITVDTSIAHLAGALGKETWVLLPLYADWRWLTGRADSPWYPTARLFRQESRGNWQNIINQISKALKAAY